MDVDANWYETFFEGDWLDVLDGDGYAETHGLDESRRLADAAAMRAQQRLEAIPADTSVLGGIVADLAARTA